ncbi:MAG: DHH family phosphoesterase, partial [Bacilli bacterium]|nr:DHH family phosphoesterase [Bacilli bacterium]
MEYILKKSSNNELINNSNLDVFSKRILSTYPLEIIDDYLNYQYIEPQFENIDEIIAKINAFMNDNKKIVIVGDYDCDGILGTSILVKGFAKLGYHVGYYIPDRLKDGYGLNRNMVTLFKNKGYDLIITIDNGINAHEAITYAIDNHIDVIVSDHHHFNEYDLLANVLYLHPQLSDLDYNISGGMVAYYLVSHLLKYNDDYLKSLASITLLSDVMPIIKNNRLMIKELLHNSNPYLPIKLLSQNKIS